MKLNNASVLALCSVVFLLFFAGIFRDDVPQRKYFKLVKQKQFDCIGKVYDSTSFRGSCIFIGSKYVLTAAHVFIEASFKPDTVKMMGQTAVLNKPYNVHIGDINNMYFEFNGIKYKGKKLTVPQEFKDSIMKGLCDIALVELEEPVSKVVPALLNGSFDELHSDVVGVGFGEIGKAAQPQSLHQCDKRSGGENVIDSIMGVKYSGEETLLACDFDHPYIKECNKMGSSVPRPLEYICSGGDSGGGLFRLNKDKWELVGICSSYRIDIQQMMKTGYFGQVMQWTRVSAFSKWIADNEK